MKKWILFLFLLINLLSIQNINAQWLYGQQLNINSTGNELTDFQIAVKLNNQSFDYSRANPDGSDIRFSTDSTFNFTPNIPYWIEKWDTLGISIIWIKIPNIPASGNTSVYMFFGNSVAQASNDPNAVFFLFDNFIGTELDTVKWNEFGFGSYSMQDSYIRFIQDNADWDKGIITSDTLSLNSYKIRTKYRLLDANSIFQIQYNISDIPGNWHLRSGMTSSFDGEYQRVTVGYINDSGTQNNDSSRSNTFITNTWYTGETWYSDSIKYTKQDSLVISSSENIYNREYLALCVFSRSASTPRVDVDWVTVRKFAQPEPEIQLGTLITSAIENNKINIPFRTELLQNYPNPFNPSTKIKYTLPKSDKVKIEVFNLLGQQVETLINKQMPSGSHEVVFTAKNLPSGVYLYRIQAGDYQEVRKMILLK